MTTAIAVALMFFAVMAGASAIREFMLPRR